MNKKYYDHLIGYYQRAISPLKRVLKYFNFYNESRCVFYPTCSQYSKEAVNKYGYIKGFWLTLRRIIRCHPWQKNHMDPLK